MIFEFYNDILFEKKWNSVCMTLRMFALPVNEKVTVSVEYHSEGRVRVEIHLGPKTTAALNQMATLENFVVGVGGTYIPQ